MTQDYHAFEPEAENVLRLIRGVPDWDWCVACIARALHQAATGNENPHEPEPVGAADNL